jgi:signal transduction histidine kinase
MENRNVQISVEIPGEIEVPMIRSRMERVFFNMITNSLEAMRGEGVIRIEALNAGNFVLIEVEDNGPGIPCAIRDRLFQPFVTAAKRNGLGLGLALSREIVLDHGGDLWSEPAVGARFVVCLPDPDVSPII